MDGWPRVPVLTLWDLATSVIEEVEEEFTDERCILALSKEILIHIIQVYVKNMEVVENPPGTGDSFLAAGCSRSGQS